jgi:hypothetical protein
MPVAAEPSATAVLTGVADPPRPEYGGRFRTDLVVGLPTALRVQVRLAGPVWGEGGVGLWTILPDFFAGLRADCRLFRGPDDSFAVRPGVAAHAFVNPFHNDGWFGGGPSGLFGVGADVDVVWQHRWADWCHGSLGVKLGATALFSRKAIVPLPVIGVLFGLHF